VTLLLPLVIRVASSKFRPKEITARRLQYYAALTDLSRGRLWTPTQTSGTGTVTATYDPATKMLTWEGNFSGLSGPATAAHFHGPAEASKNAAPAIWISEKGQNLSSPFKGSATLTDGQADDLQKGLWYAHVHTEANKGGEIRGQVVKA
jgi:hypothetical protein